MDRRSYSMVVVAALCCFASSSPVLGAEGQARQPDEGKAKDPEDAAAALPVAVVNGRTLTLGYLEAAVKRERPVVRTTLGTMEKRREYLDGLIKEELMAEEAERRGYGKHSEVESVAKNQLASLMLRRIADSIEEVEPGEAELKQYYDEHYASYHKPEKVRARHILVTDKAKAEKLLSEVMQQKMDQHAFKLVAQQNSEDEETRAVGGALQFFARNEEREEGEPEMDPELVKAAFSLKNNGEVYPRLVKGKKGYHILMRTGHRDKMDLSFDRAKDRLIALVRRADRKQKIDDSISALRERYKVEVSEENLKYVVIDLTGGPPDPDNPGAPRPGEGALPESPPVPGTGAP